jgi:hypothetical protein
LLNCKNLLVNRGIRQAAIIGWVRHPDSIKQVKGT